MDPNNLIVIKIQRIDNSLQIQNLNKILDKLMFLNYLFRGKIQVFPEGEPEDIKVLAAIPESCQYMPEHFPVLNILRIDKDHAV